MQIKHFVISVGVIAVAITVSGCKDERDEICALTWEEHGLAPDGRIFAGQNGYGVADLDRDGWIIKPEFDNFCNVTVGMSAEQLLDLKELYDVAQSIEQP
ncbi:MAG: hypothetical protein L3J05_05045 [Robiginitomaculum sp.]|nr:hypothetical protein [Robiginitomaculum sp.]